MKKIFHTMMCIILYWAAAAAPVTGVTSSNILTVYYFQRPPYYMTSENGKPQGFLVGVARMVFDQAGIPYRFVEIPPKRILLKIQEDEYSCSIGWFKNSERQSFALFSDMIYQNRPTVIVMRSKSASGFPATPTLEQVMKSHLVLGVINGFSYGPKIDAAILSFKPQIFSISGGSENLLQMIHNERLGYAFMAPEEADYLIQKDSELGSDLRIIDLADEPQGNKRYLMFCKRVGPDMINRVNDAIQIVRKTEEYELLISRVDPVKH